MKDRRIKNCPNPSCERSIQKHKYCADDVYCSVCAEELVFVCSKCGAKIDDQGPEHRTCAACTAKVDDRKDSAKKTATKVGKGLLAIGGTAALIVFTKIKK